MNWKVKFGIAAGIVALIAALCFIIWYQRQMLNKQAALESQVVEMKRLQGDVVRAQAKYVSKDDLNKFAKDNNVDLGPIRNDLKTLNAEIKGINKVIVVTPGFTGTNLPSTSTTPRSDDPNTPAVVTCPDGSTKPCPNIDKFGYLKNSQELKLEEPFGNNTSIPWGRVRFNAWREKPWDLTITPRKYTTMTVLGTDESGRHFVYNKLMINADGKEHALPITNSSFIEEYPAASFRFDPSLYLGMDVGVTFKPLAEEFVPNLQMFLFSYGKTKVNPDWIFLGLGPGYEMKLNNLSLLVSPVGYNLGNVLPLVENFYVGPSFLFDIDGNVGLFGGVRVGL